MKGLSNTFSKAVTFVEFERSGNPQEKYKSGGGILAMFNREAMRTGMYVPYIDQVFTETTNRLPELEEEIALYSSATFKLSLEHSDPEAYQRMRLLELMEGNN